jgi:hypothetical protein
VPKLAGGPARPFAHTQRGGGNKNDGPRPRSQGFRAPTGGDTFGGGSQSFDSYLDACDSKFGDAATSPATAARCAALGVPAGFRQVNQAGSQVGSGGAQTPTPFNTGGGNDVDQYRIKSTATADFVNYAGEYGTCRVKSNVSFDWDLGNWRATFASRYYSATKGRCSTVLPAVECSDPTGTASRGTGFDRKSAMVCSDLNVSYALPWKGKLMLGANNVFDKKPRIIYDTSSTFGGTSSSAVDSELPIDRFVDVRYNQKF